MILVAAAQALLRNLANLDVHWANEALQNIAWADAFLQKGTLWVALLGASLATYGDQHIAIDVLQRLAPPRVRAGLRAIVCAAAAVTCFFLAQVFRMAVLNNGADVPLDYSVLDAEGMGVHICEATARELANAGIEKSTVFCAVRTFLVKTGNPVSVPTNALELIVPAMFVVIGGRFFFKTFGNLIAVFRPPAEGEGATSERD